MLLLGQSAHGRQRARTSRGRQRGTSRGMEYDVNNKVQITMQNSFLGHSDRKQQRACSRRGRQRGSTSRGRGRGQGRSHVTPSTLPWREVRHETDLAPPCLQFSEETGPTFQMPPDTQPINFFRHLLDDSVLQLIVDETNR